MARNLFVAVLGASVVLAVSACTSRGAAAQPEPLEIVTQPTSVGDPISLEIPLSDSGAFLFDQWPSACELTDEVTLSAIFPQLESVAQNGRDRQVKILDFTGGSRPPITISEADCDTRVGFSIDGLQLDDETVVFSFSTSITAAGSSDFVDRNAPKQSGDVIQIGEANCTADERLYECRLENIAFEILIDARTYGQYFREDESAYVVDGEDIVVEFADPEPFDEIEQGVLLAVVTASIERLS